jgi:hypothetical protein
MRPLPSVAYPFAIPRRFVCQSPVHYRMAHLQKARVVKHKSNEVEIPDKFLQGPSPAPVELKPVPFASSPVPEYKKCFAVTIDNVLSPEECAQLKQLAEQSALPAAKGDPGQSVWRPATVSLAPGLEAPAPGYRESDRIVWDSQEITDRLWARCCQAEGLKDQLAVMRHRSGQGPGRWEFSHINKRMRFLRYSPGQYFKRKLKWFSEWWAGTLTDQPQHIAMVPTTMRRMGRGSKLNIQFIFTSMIRLRYHQKANWRVVPQAFCHGTSNVGLM